MNFPKRDRKYLLKITIGQCESNLLYMLILNPSRYSCQHANQTLRRATPSSIRNTPQADFATTKSVLTIHSILNNQLLLYKNLTMMMLRKKIFIDTLEKNIKDIYKKFKFQKIMIMTMHDKLVYDNFTLCHICSEELSEDKVRDLCHLSGKVRGAAHEVCNLKYTFPQFFQLYFTICLAMIATHLLKHLEIAKEIFLAYQIVKKTTFLSRNR